MSSSMALLNLVNLLTLPTIKEMNDDYATINANYKSLLPKLFNKDYDKYKAPLVPIEVNTYMLVDHIESVVRSFCFIVNFGYIKKFFVE